MSDYQYYRVRIGQVSLKTISATKYCTYTVTRNKLKLGENYDKWNGGYTDKYLVKGGLNVRL